MLPQTTTSYLYDNIIPVQILVNADVKQRNRIVYARTLKLYKGIDNEVKFSIKDQDQQVANVASYGFTLSLVDDDKKSVMLSKVATVANAAVGSLTVTFTEADLRPLENQFFTYNLLGVDPDGKTVPLYIDDNWGARGQAQVLSGHFPEYKDSEEVTLPTMSLTTEYSSYVAANTTVQTVQIFCDGFTGNVTVQATSDAVPTLGNLTANWTDVATIPFAAQTGSTIHSTEGLYSYLRFGVQADEGSVTKILYRS